MFRNNVLHKAKHVNIRTAAYNVWAGAVASAGARAHTVSRKKQRVPIANARVKRLRGEEGGAWQKSTPLPLGVPGPLPTKDTMTWAPESPPTQGAGVCATELRPTQKVGASSFKHGRRAETFVNGIGAAVTRGVALNRAGFA